MGAIVESVVVRDMPCNVFVATSSPNSPIGPSATAILFARTCRVCRIRRVRDIQLAIFVASLVSNWCVENRNYAGCTIYEGEKTC